MSDSLIFFYLIKREYIGLFTIKCKEMLINFMLCLNLKVCTRSVRSALEYAVLSWQSIPGCLSDKIESTQKSALMIIFPCADSYLDALELARVETLMCRRDKICKEYICKMKDLNHPLHPLLPTRLDDTCPYTLRHKSDQLHFYKNVTTCRTKRNEDFFTFKCF